MSLVKSSVGRASVQCNGIKLVKKSPEDTRTFVIYGKGQKNDLQYIPFIAIETAKFNLGNESLPFFLETKQFFKMRQH